jgi:hypothetical protein
LISEGEVKSVVDFKEGKVFEVLGYTLNRQGFFIEGFVPDFMASAGNPFLLLHNFSYRVRYLRKIRMDLVLSLCSMLYAFFIHYSHSH